VIKQELIKTKDGSATLYSKRFDECYHSTNDGALSESLYKHITPAFELIGEKNNITILDICFGLGYNTLTTLYYLKKHSLDKKVHIISPEFDEELIKSLKDFDYPNELKEYRDIIKELANSGYYRDSNIEIELFIGDARELLKSLIQRGIKIDIVYQDAFSPKKNPLLWTREYFEDISKIASKDIILTTYSSATLVRMGLYESGFKIYKAPDRGVRRGTIASFRELELEEVDMELKKSRNPDAKSLRDHQVSMSNEQ